MQRAGLLGFGILAIVVAGFFALNAYIYNEKQADTPQEDLAAYFEEQMIRRGIENIGRPREGFDSQILMTAYPGLTESDFRDVEAFEGKYMFENNQAVFIRTHSQPVSSAERTLSSVGYAKLLENLSARLSHPVYVESDVDALIADISPGERLEGAIGTRVQAFGVGVVPLEVLEDSRCPMDVQCIQAGTVRLKASVESGLGNATHVFVMQEPFTTEAEEITLVSVSPLPRAGSAIDASEYAFTFEIKERGNATIETPSASLPTEPVACTMDAMQCPDGTWIGRTGPKCEFVCP